MRPLAFTSGDAARLGGVDITISLTAAEAAALGDEDYTTIADWVHTALWAMAMLRTGTGADEQGNEYTPGPDDWYHVVNAVDHRLLPRFEGIRDAAVRAHADGGGSVGQLALAMDVARSTAQYRREVLLRTLVSQWEAWATGGGPQNDAAAADDGEGGQD